jgi:hypothetical protein
LDVIETYTMSTSDFGNAQIALKADVNCFVINGIDSFASAINSISKSNYSWGFIQAYYCLFFFARAFIGISNYAIVYKDKTPYRIKIQPAEKFKKLKGNSHEVVLNEYKKNFSFDLLLSNQIDGKSPVEWFNEMRNTINYKSNPFTDPIPPLDLFKFQSNIRKWITNYFNDDVHKYTFDPCHCYIAYPVQLFSRIHGYYIDNDFKNDYLTDEMLLFLSKNISDEKGQISSIIEKVREISLRE